MTEGDLFPDRRNVPDVLRTVARLARQRRGAARAGWRNRVRARAAAARAEERQRARAAARHRHARDAAARARLPRGAQGQVAPVEAGQRARLERRRPGADRARLRLRRLGAAGRRRRRQGRDVRRRQRGHDPRGLGRGLHAPGGAVARPRATCPSRSAWSSRSSTRTTCSATRRRTRRAATRPSEFRDLGVPLPPTVDEDLRDKPTVHSLMKLGQTAYIGALDDDAAQQRLRQLLRLPAPGGRREDRPRCWRRSATRATRARCARAR